MQKSNTVYLRDIRDAIAEIHAIVGDRDAQSVLKNHEVYYSVLYLLVVIGEASGRLNEEFKSDYPDIPWEKVKGMRNILIHEYAGVSFDVVWRTVTDRLPELNRAVEDAIENEK